MLTQSAVTELPRFQPSFPLTRKTTESASPAPAGVPMSFARNAEIFAEGETSGYLYKVVSGVVRVSNLLPDGRRQISAFHLPGDMFGFETDDVYHASAEAVVPVKVIAYKWQGLIGAGPQSSSVVRELLRLTMMGLRQAQEHVLLLGRKNALERLSAFVLEMAVRSDAKGVLDLAMPRHDIADYLGLTLETVSRMFAELKELGAIKLESARRVHLLDTARLKTMGA